jgi:Tfp pilus assembly protein PilO
MTGRDRIVLISVIVVAILAAAWIMVVTPEREQARKLSAQVGVAKTQLASAEGKLASARAAQSQYATAYAAMVSIGKAVPPTQEVPALIEQLTRASNQKNVEFSSIATSSTGSSASSASTAGLSQLPFTFVFEGSFFHLEHLLGQLTDFATPTASGGLQVSGRLLTIQSVKLAPSTSTAGQGKDAATSLTGSITATAYVLPGSQGVSAAGGAGSPAAATAPASSTTGASSSPTAPAIVRVNP